MAQPRAEPIERLRDDVRLLGSLVGEVLREQGGADLFAAVEHLRTAAIAERSPGSATRRDADAVSEASADHLHEGHDHGAAAGPAGDPLLDWAGAQSDERL